MGASMSLLKANTMIWLWYFILIFFVGSFLFVGSDADYIEFIAEKRRREGLMAKRTPITAEGCVEICEHLNTCFAVNYFRLNAPCQLLNQTVPESKPIKTTKCFYKAVRSPSQESIDNDHCFKLTCPWDEICKYNTTTNLAECYPFCNTPPMIYGAIFEMAEVDVSQNYTYKCKSGLFGNGYLNPTITCLENGSWTSTNVQCGWTYAGIWDTQEEGTWIGWDGEVVYLFWYPGEPSGGTAENYGLIVSDHIGILDK